MNDHYELYDGASFNLIADAATEGEILAILRNTIAQYGESAVTGLVLMREDGRYVEGSKWVVAADSHLLQMALASGQNLASRR